MYYTKNFILLSSVRTEGRKVGGTKEGRKVGGSKEGRSEEQKEGREGGWIGRSAACMYLIQ